jgi:hypothetical protein
MKISLAATRSALSRALLVAILAPPLVASAQFTTPNVINVPGDVTNVLGSTTFINHGLVAVGHISASTIDPFGESFGSVSSMQITGWTNHGDGTYSGTINILPDRGYNIGNFYSDYAARINQARFTLTPYYGSTNIGGTTDLEKLNAQTNQLSFGAITGVRFTYDDPTTGAGSFTTGLDPGTNSTTLFGQTMPYVTTYVGFQSPSATTNDTYNNINKLPIDAEALIIKADGSGYVGDEYGANIYYFDATKKIVGAIVPPPAFQPHSPVGVLNYSSAITPLNGRRNNQGFEGVSLSPDGTRLFALQQSACVQDSTQAANNQNAKNTRLLIYDVSTNPTNSTPLAEYALTLPTYKGSGNGAAVDKTCAQSEVVALDNHRFLVLPRDGNGLGNALPNPNVYKSVVLVDINTGTPSNIVNDSARNVEGGTITSNGVAGVLDPTITPLKWVEAVNMLNTNQLGKFNIQFDTGTGQVTKLTMGEKWEGMALVPAKDPTNPNDYFLFVGNDNDFLTSAGQIKGPDGTIVNYNGFNGYPANRIPAPVDSPNSENDTRILVFRVTIATGFNAGNLVAERAGDGSAALTSAGTPIFIQEYTPTGELVQTKTLPNAFPRPTGNPYNALDSGSATSNGQLSRSADGRFICVPAYNGTNGESGIAGSSSATIVRVIGLLDGSGAVDTSRAAAILTGNNYRSVTSSDGTNFWAVGQPGLVYFQPGVATNVLLTSNLRSVKIFNNQLFVCTGSGTTGVQSVGTGLPTNGTQTATQVITVGGASPSPYNFEFNPGFNVAYVADDRNNVAGGVIKYTNNGTAWVSNYTFSVGGAVNGARGIAVDWSGANPVIYATTAETSASRLVKIVDTGAAATATTIATAPVNTAFRGLAFAPTSGTVLVAPVIVSQTALGDGSFQASFSGPSGQTFRLLVSTNIMQPLSSWATLTNGTFSAGPSTYTDTAAIGQPQRYYIVVSP